MYHFRESLFIYYLCISLISFEMYIVTTNEMVKICYTYYVSNNKCIRMNIYILLISQVFVFFRKGVSSLFIS